MPSRHLKLMGLLADEPMRSPVLRRFANPQKGRHYTKSERQHLVATMHTPNISRTWVDYQFQRLFGWNPGAGIYKLKTTADKYPQYRHFGQQNIPLLTRQHVIRFYQRRDPSKRCQHPPWARAVIYDLQKEGLTAQQIADLLHTTLSVIENLLYRDRPSLFTPYRRGNHANLAQNQT